MNIWVKFFGNYSIIFYINFHENSSFQIHEFKILDFTCKMIKIVDEYICALLGNPFPDYFT